MYKLSSGAAAIIVVNYVLVNDKQWGSALYALGVCRCLATAYSVVLWDCCLECACENAPDSDFGS